MEVLKKNHKMYLQKLIDALPAYILLIDDLHHIIMANKSVTQHLKVQPEKIIGEYCPMVIHGMNKPFPGCPLEEVVETGGFIEKEVYDEQNHRWVKSSVYPLEFLSDDGRKIYFHTIYDITDRKKTELSLKKNLEELQHMTLGVITTLGKVVASRDSYTAMHQRRVSNLAVRIAQKMRLPDDQIEGILLAGLVHDIGKIAVPSEILTKQGHINNHEYSIIKSHSQVGYDILKDIKFPWPLAEAVFQHHEREDGSGYPKKLVGKQIIVEAKILAVADVVEAISFHRPYREALGLAKAIDEIDLNRGKLYDDDVVTACLKEISEDSFTF